MPTIFQPNSVFQRNVYGTDLVCAGISVLIVEHLTVESSTQSSQSSEHSGRDASNKLQ